jgi:hypothetical protein
MLKSTVLSHFKSNRIIAAKLDISTVAVFRWGEVVPYWVAEEVERITEGKLKVRRRLYARGRPLKGAELRRVLDARRLSARKQVDDAALSR